MCLCNTGKANLNAPLFGDVTSAVDALLFVLVLVKLTVPVVEPEAISALAEALLTDVVLFALFAVSAGVGEGAAAAAVDFYCVCVQAYIFVS